MEVILYIKQIYYITKLLTLGNNKNNSSDSGPVPVKTDINTFYINDYYENYI